MAAVPLAATGHRPPARAIHADAIAHRRRPSKVFLRALMRPVNVAVRRATDPVMDVLMLLAVILSIPFVILAVGMPVALGVQLLLWIGRLL
jgi:hypothetical protein